LDQPGVVRRVQEAVPARVSVENDVKLVALAESALGAAIEADSSVMLWAQGGVGSATVIEGRVHRGTTGSAGELDFLPVARMSGSGDQWQNGFQAWANREAVAQLGSEHDLSGSPREMIASAVADPDAGHQFLQELAERYATGIAALVAVVDPDLVVLSGSYMFTGGDELARRIESAVAERAMRAVPVAIGQLRDQPVLAGASPLADRQLREILLEAVGPTASRSAHRSSSPQPTATVRRPQLRGRAAAHGRARSRGCPWRGSWPAGGRRAAGAGWCVRRRPLPAAAAPAPSRHPARHRTAAQRW